RATPAAFGQLHVPERTAGEQLVTQVRPREIETVEGLVVERLTCQELLQRRRHDQWGLDIVTSWREARPWFPTGNSTVGFAAVRRASHLLLFRRRGGAWAGVVGRWWRR